MASPSSPTLSGDDHIRRTFKRDREADTSAQQPTTPSETIPTKKNRLESAETAVGSPVLASAAATDPPTGTGSQGVRHISQKVKDLGWEEQQKLASGTTKVGGPSEADAADITSVGRSSSSTTVAGGGAATETPAQSQEQDSQHNGEQSDSRRTDADESLAASSASGARTAKSPQLSFGAFSSRSNPFSAGRTASSAGSIFAGTSSQGDAPSQHSSLASTNSSATVARRGAAEEAPAQSQGQDSQQTGEQSGSRRTDADESLAASSASGARTAKSPQLSFGAFSSRSNPFSAGRTASSASSIFAGTSSQGDAPSQHSSLASSSSGAPGSWLDSSQSLSTVAEATDLTTGEEAERTVFSTRAKLYEMDTETQNWKERGTGTVKCNVPNESIGGLFGAGRGASGPGTAKRRSAARLVMRTEGVLRLILNVVLFPGMSIELASERFVRFSAFENDKLVHLALRISQPRVAEELVDTVKSRIPAAPAASAAGSSNNTSSGAEPKSADTSKA